MLTDMRAETPLLVADLLFLRRSSTPVGRIWPWVRAMALGPRLPSAQKGMTQHHNSTKLAVS